MNKITKPENYFVKTNLLKNRYVTDGVIWTVDETIFNDETKLFLVVSINTRAILGYIQGKNCRNSELIIELYKQILNDYEFPSKPCFIHSDMEETYHSKDVQEYLTEEGIYVSTTEGAKNQNQLSESVNGSIKYRVAKILLEKSNSQAYREFARTLPENLRSIRIKKQRCLNKEFRKHLFKSKLFKSQRQEVIERAIRDYNNKDFTKGITRQEAQYYDLFIEGRNIDNTRLVTSKHIVSKLVENDNVSSIQEVKTKISEILSSNSQSETKIAEIISLVAQRQDSSDELVKQGFVGLAIQNTELKDKIDKLQEELQVVTTELLLKRQEEQLMLERKQRRKNRKRLPQRDPVTEEIYEYLIQRANESYHETYHAARLRLAIALLAVTGVRIGELLPLQVNQLENLFKRGWIAIDRTKSGPSCHKAFLTRKGKNIIKKRAKDFETILRKKQTNSYVFTPEYASEPLNRESFTKLVNKFLKESSDTIPYKPVITSHSFRIGFITQLWKDTEDIEFVRQSIGHAKIDTTSRYVQNLTEEERRNRMIDLKTSEDLFF